MPAKPRDRQEVTDEHLETETELEETDLQPDPDEELDDETGGESDDDAGDTGDEDTSGDHEEETERPGEVRQSRGNRDIGRLRAERREARERAERLERENAELRARTASQPSPDQQRQRQEDRARELETARLESPEKYVEVALRQQREDFTQQLGMVQVSSTDAQDAAKFDRLCARNPAINEIAEDVERELANLRRSGGNMPREFIAKYILGDRAIARGARAKNKQQRQADGARQRERTRPGGGARSDVTRTNTRGGSEAQKRFDRIKDIPI